MNFLPPDAEASFDSTPVGGVPFQIATLESTARWLVEQAGPRRIAVNIRLANAYNVALADADPNYRDLLEGSGLNFPDGTPVVWAMNMKRGPAKAQRVRGPSLFALTMEYGAAYGTRHFLLGSTPETLPLLSAELNRRYPGVIISGVFSPPFAAPDDAYVNTCAAAVRDSETDLVWVGLGTPKQDIVGTALASSLGLTTINVGAAFDFVAGTVREAPRWVQNSGFEWLYRLFSEPRRLWRRYLFGNLRFVRSVLAHWRR